MKPQPNKKCLDTDDIINTIRSHGDSVATVMLGGVNYYTGQKYDMKEILSRIIVDNPENLILSKGFLGVSPVTRLILIETGYE